LKLLLQVHVHNVHVWHMQAFSYTPFHQNRTFIGLKSIYKGLLPKQHIKYKTKTVNYNQTTFVHIYAHCQMWQFHENIDHYYMLYFDWYLNHI
jgi:hypothetical protein